MTSGELWAAVGVVLVPLGWVVVRVEMIASWFGQHLIDHSKGEPLSKPAPSFRGGWGRGE